MIRLLIVDDSPFVREQLRGILLRTGDMIVVGEAVDGRHAIEMVPRTRPDVIIMDVDMPVMDGIDATRVIMEEMPTPILIHTSSYISRSRNVPFAAIQMGALDIIEKPKVYPLGPAEEKELIGRIRLLAGIKVFRRRRLRTAGSEQTAALPAQVHMPEVLAIGASTGGPKALFDLFSLLPPFLPFPILLVQHIGASFVSGFIEWLQTTTKVQMKIAGDGDLLLPNTCYVSPGGIHLSLRLTQQIHLNDGPPLHSCKPSVDVLFEAVTAVFQAHAVGILLTGIGEDGAKGLLSMRTAGATTIAQDEESSIVYGMPRRAAELHAASIVASVPQTADHIRRLFHLS